MLSAIFFGHAATAHGQALLLNEVEADAPDAATQFACQYAELRGTPGATVPANYYFVSINGAAASFGDLQFIVPLGGRTVGANGTITIINSIEGTCPGRTLPAGTTTVAIEDFDGLGLQDSGARTFAIITAPSAPAAGADIDLNNDRVIDPASGVAVIDGIGFTTNVDFQAVYAPNLYNAAVEGGNTLVPDAATRFPSNNTPLSAAAWYFGELASSPPNTTVYTGSPQSANFPAGGALTPGGPNVGGATVAADAVADFNGDGRTDYSVARTSGVQVTWYNSINGLSETSITQWGLSGDVPVTEDYDNDNKDDIAVWRPGAPFAAAFYILQSSNSTVRTIQFGQTGDDPAITGDWDGDGSADPAVYRDSAFGNQSGFYYRGSLNNPTGGLTFIPFGLTGDLAVRGDFDADAKIDAAVYRPSNQNWYVRNSGNAQVSITQFGLASDTRVSGDFDGDARTDIAVFRSGTWIILRSSNGQISYSQWGTGGDIPVTGDYNGDGSADLAIWRSGTFYVSQSGGGVTFFPWGTSGDLPVASVFNN